MEGRAIGDIIAGNNYKRGINASEVMTKLNQSKDLNHRQELAHIARINKLKEKGNKNET